MEENIGAVELAVTEDEFNVCNEIWNKLRPQRFFYGHSNCIVEAYKVQLDGARKDKIIKERPQLNAIEHQYM